MLQDQVDEDPIMIDALDIHVKGIVQGVGFRPFVYKLAKKYLINGWVKNGIDGVHIRAEGESEHVDEFVLEISENAPQAAQISEIEMHEVPIEPYDTFEIILSDENETDEITFVSPDLAICDDCRSELLDPENRRYRYPFINCTNCGPRFTIIDKLPYDRPNTSMAPFIMCEECQNEYDDPSNRRFHAQPDSCFVCGPRLTFRLSPHMDTATYGAADATNEITDIPSVEEVERVGDRCHDDAPRSISDHILGDEEILHETTRMLVDGKILAVKGLGGYHLVCDANNAEAVAELRTRKKRDGKPFAVMLESLDDVRRICHVSDEEASILDGSIKPIVLLRKWTDVDFTRGIADGLTELGVMLPYTPLQVLIMHDFAELSASCNPDLSDKRPPMLIMTSGNIHDEPIAIDDDEAFEMLKDVADGFIGNDRRIVTRFDDSVVRVLHFDDLPDVNLPDAIQMIRRARGYAPSPVLLDLVRTQNEATAEKTIFATGAEQKNTFCFLCSTADSEDPQEAFVSQHIGDMENLQTFDSWLLTKQRYESLFDLKAQSFACDLHPEYMTTKWAHEKAALESLSLTQVQHHFAHVVSTMAENKLEGPVCGIAFDGTGYGVDGNIWGGEVLLCNLKDFERFMNFAYVPMPGGAAAIKEPLRMAYGVLWEFDLLDDPGAERVLQDLGEEQVELCEKMIERGLNTPVTSSVGRLFDAASAILGVCTKPEYEGEAAILLEASIDRESDVESDYEISVIKNTATESSTARDTSVLLFDAAPVFASMLGDITDGFDVGIIAKKFHDAFVNAIVNAAELANSLYEMSTVVLTGGVFMNRYITEHVVPKLAGAGFTVVLNRELPPNDGCISLGQAVVGFMTE